MIIHNTTHNQIWKESYGFYINTKLKVNFHWDKDEIMPWYYVMILGVIYSL